MQIDSDKDSSAIQKIVHIPLLAQQFPFVTGSSISFANLRADPGVNVALIWGISDNVTSG